MRPLQKKKAMSLTCSVHVRPVCHVLVLHLSGKVKGEPSQFLTTGSAERQIYGKTAAMLRRGLASGTGWAIMPQTEGGP